MRRSLSVFLLVRLYVSVSLSVNAFLDHKSGVPICHPRETRCRQLPTLGGMSELPVSPSASNFPQLSSLWTRESTRTFDKPESLFGKKEQLQLFAKRLYLVQRQLLTLSNIFSRFSIVNTNEHKTRQLSESRTFPQWCGESMKSKINILDFPNLPNFKWKDCHGQISNQNAVRGDVAWLDWRYLAPGSLCCTLCSCTLIGMVVTILTFVDDSPVIIK